MLRIHPLCARVRSRDGRLRRTVVVGALWFGSVLDVLTPKSFCLSVFFLLCTRSMVRIRFHSAYCGMMLRALPIHPGFSAPGLTGFRRACDWGAGLDETP